MTKRPQKTFAQELGELMKRKNKKPAEVAIITGVLERSIYDYINGEYEPNPFKRAGILDRLGRAK